jgi:hypothetical protein
MADINVYVYEGAANSFPNYDNLDLALSDNEQDLTAVSGIFNVEIQGTWSVADTTATISNTWVTNTDFYVNIFTTGAARHNGIWSDTAYRIIDTSTSHGIWIALGSTKYAAIDGLQIDKFGSTSNRACIGGGATNFTVKNCILAQSATAINNHGIVLGSQSLTTIFEVYNNVVYSTNSASFKNGITCLGVEGAGKIYNNTVNGFSQIGIRAQVKQYIKNNLVNDCTTAISSPTGDPLSGSGYNATDNASIGYAGSLPGDRVNQTFGFVNEGNYNFNLTPSDTGANNFGADVSNDPQLAFTTDITDATRLFGWDIGAFQSIMVPTVIDPNIPEWKGHMPLDWLYTPFESIWNGGYTWNNPNSFWNNGLDSGFWGVDLDFDLNNDGNWTTCLNTDGTNNSNHNLETFSWKQFLTSWDIIGQGLNSDSDNCRIRCRLKNRRNNLYSQYGYYGPVRIRILPYPIFLGFGDEVSYRWQPSTGSSDYPQDIFDVSPNIKEHATITGARHTVRHGINVQRFSLFFPALSLTDIENYKTFMENIDWKKNPFIYRDKEVNYENPFSGTWKSTWVKFDQDLLEINRDRNDTYELTINMRATQETLVT